MLQVNGTGYEFSKVEINGVEIFPTKVEYFEYKNLINLRYKVQLTISDKNYIESIKDTIFDVDIKYSHCDLSDEFELTYDKLIDCKIESNYGLYGGLYILYPKSMQENICD